MLEERTKTSSNLTNNINEKKKKKFNQPLINDEVIGNQNKYK
jgi:hypothetical protein